MIIYNGDKWAINARYLRDNATIIVISSNYYRWYTINDAVIFPWHVEKYKQVNSIPENHKTWRKLNLNQIGL